MSNPTNQDTPVAWLTAKTLAQLQQDGSFVGVQTTAYKDQIKSGNAVALYSSDQIDRMRAERDALRDVVRKSGICMSCAISAPEPYGCVDCLNTGWGGGSPPNAPEDIKQLFSGIVADFARMRERAERAEALLDGSEEDRRERKLDVVVAPDNGTAEEVLTAVLRCAYAWVPEARIIGNVRAGDIARAVEFALTKLQDTSHE